MATEFKRMVLKISDVTTEVATIPATNDHTDGSWISTDIYEGELFLNTVDNVLQTRTESGIITLNGGGGGSVSWGSIIGTLSSQTDLQTELDDKIDVTDFSTAHSVLVQQTGTGTPTLVTLSDNEILGKLAGSIVGLDSNDIISIIGDSTLIPTPAKESSSRALTLADRNNNLENDADVIFTVPLNSSVAFPIGSQIFFTKKVETMSFVAEAGVTINSVDNLLEIDRINAGASLLKIDNDEWNLIGELK